MNKKYMDFVPAKSSKARETARVVSIQTTTQTEVVNLIENQIAQSNSMPTKPVNNFDARFIKTDVPKRPLSQKPFTAGDALTALKAQKIKAKKSPNATLKQIKEVPATESLAITTKSKNTYQPPKNPFLNQVQVAKRPLSRNIYLKELEHTKKSPAENHNEPIMVSTVPEKKSPWKTILAIIATIIVGAAAGVAAFLLLPK